MYTDNQLNNLNRRRIIIYDDHEILNIKPKNKKYNPSLLWNK